MSRRIPLAMALCQHGGAGDFCLFVSVVVGISFPGFLELWPF